MRRWTFRLLAAVSLIVACITAVLWVRSYRMQETFQLVDRVSTGTTSWDERLVGVMSVRGTVFVWYHLTSAREQPAGRDNYFGPEYLGQTIGPQVQPPFYKQSSWWSRRGISIGRVQYATP